ncbi:MAG: amino acid adenylation domain-containing protein [Bacteroidetes bacterium]|nr:amino acid adenylation domain-containing protein [Bacteroidota bacterium]
MSILEIIEACRQCGVVPESRGDMLVLNGSTDRLPEELLSLIRENKGALQEFLAHHQGSAHFSSIPVVPEENSYAASGAQKRMWLLSRLENGVAAYTIVTRFLIRGALDQEAFSRAFRRVIERHDSLRTIFKQEGEELRHIVLREIPFEVEWQASGSVEEESRLADRWTFDLQRGPLLRARVLALPSGDHVLFFGIHHLVSDGQSVALLLKEVLSFYRSAGESVAAPPLSIQYKDYCRWLELRLAGDAGNTARKYWRDVFSDVPGPLNLPTDFLRPPFLRFEGATHRYVLGNGFYSRASAFCKEHRFSLFNFLHTALSLLLSRYGGQQDLVIGTPVAARNHFDLQEQIGLYVNTLPLRTRIADGDSVRSLIRKNAACLASALPFQDYPLDRIVADAAPPRDVSRHPLFDVLIVLQDTAAGGRTGQGLSSGLELLSPDLLPELAGACRERAGFSKFDLSFIFNGEPGGDFFLEIEYSTHLYRKETIHGLFNSYMTIVDAMIERPDAAVDEVPLVPAANMNLLLEAFNDTAAEFDQDKTLIGLFEEQAAANPDRIVLISGSVTLTFARLNEWSGKLARYLSRRYSIIPDDLVAVRLDRTERMIVALLAILKAGGAYLPVDPQYPEDRTAYILSDSGCKAVIDEAEWQRFESAPGDECGSLSLPVARPENLAYVIYTSGSTGRPKGCMLEHRGAVNRIEWMWHHYGFEPGDIVLQKTTFTFDVSVWEIFLPLCMGCRMVLCSRADAAQPQRIMTLIEEQGITCLHFVPTFLNAFTGALSPETGAAYSLRSLRRVFASGEALSAATVSDWYRLSTAPLHNLYGPTEASVDVSYYATNPGDTRISIGRPIWNTRLYILLPGDQAAPVGAVGEIGIGGIGLARGYLHQPELTSSRFTADPFKAGERMYRTGDLGRWLPDGNIEFLGRKDEQLKIRGYRIEPGEIEAALNTHSKVAASVVTGVTGPGGQPELAVYLVGEGSINEVEVRAHLAGLLPAYMLPSKYIQVGALPLTASGKVDKKRLATVPVLSMTSVEGSEEPGTWTEKRLAQLWTELLGREDIGRKDNYFDLGGHSLRVIALAARIQREFRVRIEIPDLFIAATLEQQAALIEQGMPCPAEPIRRLATADGYPLSASQRRLWILCQFEQASIAYNVAGAIVLEGQPDLEALDFAFQCLYVRHESLRTVFRADDRGEPVQVVLEPGAAGMSIHHVDLRSHSRAEETLRRMVSKEFSTPFDLREGPLCRMTLFYLGEDNWVFCFVTHHMISDGVSMNLLIKELVELYNARVCGYEARLTPLDFQYRDFAAWQLERLAGENGARLERYWKNVFKGELPVMSLPFEKNRPAVKTFSGSKEVLWLEPELSQGLHRMAAGHEATMFMIMLTAVKTLLFKYTGLEDIIIGGPLAAREFPGLQDQIGFYANTLAFRTRFKAENTFAELLAQVRQGVLGAFAHSEYPLDLLVEALHLHRDSSRSPLFEIEVMWQEEESVIGEGRIDLKGVSSRLYEAVASTSSRFDLVFDFSPFEGGIKAELIFNDLIYDSESVKRILEHLRYLLGAIVARPSAPIHSLSCVGPAERELVTNGFNNTSVRYPRDKTIVDLFKEQVATGSDLRAVVFGGMTLTYRELDEQSDRLAHYIRSQHGPAADELIGVMMDRSHLSVVVIIAILKSGAAYLPIDPVYPAARKEFIIRESNLRLLITESAYLFDLPDYEGQVFATDIQLAGLPAYYPAPAVSIRPVDLAYVIYTSGSTGKPKGVMIEHDGIANTIQAQRVIFDARRGDGHLQFASFSFDASVSEIFVALSSGGTLFIADEETRRNPEKFETFLADNAIRIATIPPAFLRQLNPRALESLRTLVTAGEAADRRAANEFLPVGDYVNAYGPTETSICASSFSVKRGGHIRDAQVPIGKPIANTHILITDRWGEPVPVGVTGEIRIGGIGVARGYLNNAELTAEKFRPDPSMEGGRMYLTGDLGRWLPDGHIEFLGRNDHQVKVRGYRIETGEIESVLTAWPGITASLVIASDEEGEKELVAYIETAQDPDLHDLRGHLSASLPSFMMPAHIVRIESWPLTVSGKVDRQRLPSPRTGGMGPGISHVAPQTAVEERLAAIWKDVTGKETIGRNDNFFDLGGHSLKIARLATMIHRAFDVKVDLKDLFSLVVLKDQAKLIEQSARDGYTAIPTAPLLDDYPLSSSQQRLYVLSQIGEGNRAYTITGAYRLRGRVLPGVMEGCFNELVRRHENLRTLFREKDGEVRQVVIPAGDSVLKLSLSDLRKQTGTGMVLQDILAREREEVFDLGRGPLIRISLIRLEEEEWILSCVMHHIISDGWSMEILTRELWQLYELRISGSATELQALRIQYKDYAVWQQDQLNGGALSAQRDYWMKQFKGGTPVLDLPADAPRPAEQSYNGRVLHRTIGPETARAFKSFCRKQESSLFMGLLSAVEVLLYRHTGQRDIVIGVPAAGREHADLKDPIGFFVNTLPLRINIDDSWAFSDLLECIRQLVLGAFSNQAYPFDRILEDLGGKRDKSRHPIFDVMVALQNSGEEDGGERLTESGIHVARYETAEQPASKFDLLFEFIEEGDVLRLRVEYNRDLYLPETIGQMANHLEQLLMLLPASSQTNIARLDYLTASEKNRLLGCLDHEGAVFPADATIIRCWEEQVIKTPDRPAVACGERVLSYDQVNGLANRLAGYLRDRHAAGRRDYIGIVLDRSEWMVIAMLAILKAGAVYVPIDPAYPMERKDFMLSDSGCKAVIDEREIGLFRQVAQNYPAGDPEPVAAPGDPAYVIYTSGTTGKPKGTQVTHRNVVRLLKTEPALYDFGEMDVWTLFHSYCFDFSVWEIYGALFFGGKLVIVPSEALRDPRIFLRLLADERVTVLNQTPSAFYQLSSVAADSEAAQLSLRYVIFGGEALSPARLADWKQRYPDTRLINMYGITETTVHVTYKEITAGEIGTNSRSIGVPIPTLSCYLLDENLLPVPQGVWGELYIGGEGVADGYLNRDSLTQLRFLPNPFKQGRLYRSGDRGRLLWTGEIEYGGRADDQVKVRGYRIELKEIETVLRQHEAVLDVAVTGRPDRGGETVLVAYLVGKGNLQTTELRAFLAVRLPAYMIPGYYVQLQKLPLTGNGKLDSRALPEPEDILLETGTAYVAPRNETESRLAEIWQDLLGRPRVGVRDDFFESGGHSLKATRLAAMVHRTFGVRLELKTIFQRSILEEMAGLIGESRRTIFSPISALPQGAGEQGYELSSSQRRLWILCQVDEINKAYVIPGLFILDREPGQQAINQTIVALTERHEILRTTFQVENGGLIRQYIQPPSTTGIASILTVEGSTAYRREQIASLVRQEKERGFDLENGPLFRIRKVPLEDGCYLFIFLMHHIAGDEWSMEILLKEFEGYYRFFSGIPVELPAPLPFQYKDYAAWQQRQLAGAGMHEHRQYWLDRFSGRLPVLDLVMDLPRPAKRSYKGAVVVEGIDGDSLSEIIRAGGQATLNMYLLTGVFILLHRYTGQKDIIIGSPFAGRQHADLEGQVGFYVNTLALRIFIEDTDSFSTILEQVKNTTLSASEHQAYPFDELVEALSIPRDRSRHPLFDVMAVLQRVPTTENNPDPDSLTLETVELTDDCNSKFDLLFLFRAKADGLQLVLQYDTDLFYGETIRRMARHLKRILQLGAAFPHEPAGRLCYLEKSEQAQLLEAFSGTANTFPVEASVVDLWREQVRLTPDKTALIYEDEALSYRELDDLSDRVAHYLLDRYAIQPEDRIGVYLDRSEWLIAVIIGILKSGAAYVPIDPYHPSERVGRLLEAGNCRLLVDQYMVERIKAESTAREQKGRALASPAPGQLAYVMFTSGSTGAPKGVMVEHRSIVRLVKETNFVRLTGEETLLSTGAISFDATTFEYWSMLLNGGRLVLCSKETLLDPRLLASTIQEQGVTMMWFTAGWLSQLVDGHIALFEGLVTLLAGGDRLSPQHIAALRARYPSLDIINGYGPTENTTFSLTYSIGDVTDRIPIGRPVRNSTVYILDSFDQPCPIGVSGEICVGGAGLARGYINQPELTAQRYIPHPYIAGERLYRTGDLGLWLADGNVIFLGRMDSQVKIRGHRIEPGEIETLLMQYPGVGAAVVKAVPAGGSAAQEEKALAVYMTGDLSLDTGAVRRFLAARLPAYMLPSRYLVLDQLPLNTNGKVDMERLPSPGMAARETGAAYVAPRNKVEEQLVRIWQDILGREDVGVQDDFFELGGHSLSAIQLIGRINGAFPVHLSVKNLFEEPTPEAVGRYLGVLIGQRELRADRSSLTEIEL